jgi:hypothetical protein
VTGVVIVQRLTLKSGVTLEQTCVEGHPRMSAESYGVVHETDSDTGKSRGDVDVYPWHAVESLKTWRKRA